MMCFGTFTCDRGGLTELFDVRTCKAMVLPLVGAAKRNTMWWTCVAKVGGIPGCSFSNRKSNKYPPEV